MVAESIGNAYTNIRLILHDGLTGIPRRELFDFEYQSRLLDALRNESELSLVYLDATDLKGVNDGKYGLPGSGASHECGDAYLCAIAQGLRSAIKEEKDFCGRMGGDEFAAVIPGVGEEQLPQVIQRIKSAIKSRVLETGRCYFAELPTEPVAIAGLSLQPYLQKGGDAKDFFYAVDQEMYRIKEEQKAQVQQS